MMEKQAKDFEKLLERIRTQEASSRRHALLWALLPVSLALLLLVYSWWQIQAASTKVQELEQTATSLNSEITNLKEESDAEA